MIPLSDLALFAGAALLMVLTPGPNMAYLISRTICQGPRAGVISLLGVVAAFGLHMAASALGLTALFMAVPLAYELLRWAGAAYLLYLAWQAVRPGARAVFEARDLPHDSNRKLFWMGFMTNLLNPKIAVFYLSILPQFIAPAQGSALAQSLTLGTVQIAISFSVNLIITLSAARLAGWFAGHSRWLHMQRWVMGSVLAALALRMATQQRHTA